MPNQSKPKGPETLADALAEFQKQVKTANREGTAKDRGNRERKYSTLEDLLKALEPALELGLSHSQTFDFLPLENEVLTILVTTLFFKDEKIESKLPLRDPKNPNVMHALGTSITYSRRYALGAIYGIGSEEDDDAMSLNDQSNQKQSSTINRSPQRGANAKRLANEMITGKAPTSTPPEQYLPLLNLEQELRDLAPNLRTEALKQFKALRFPKSDIVGNKGLFELIKTEQHINDVKAIMEDIKSDSP